MKISKKVLMLILVAIIAICAMSSKVFATTNGERAYNAFKEFKYNATEYLSVNGTKGIEPYIVNKYLNPEVSISNTDIVEYNKSDYYGYFYAKTEGTTNVTISVKYNGKVEKKSFKITVVKDYKTALFNKFKDYKYGTYNLLIGEKFGVKPSEDIYELNPKFEVKNSNIVEVRKAKMYDNNYAQYYKAKNEGSTAASITVTFEGKTVKKDFKINVKKLNDTKLESKVNDVKSITAYTAEKTQVLLANGELWNTHPTEFKLTTKATGNVAKHVYTTIYYEFDEKNKERAKTYVSLILSTLKNDKQLTVVSSQKTLKAKNVVDMSNVGYLDTKGNYYGIATVNGFLQFKKLAAGVNKLIGDRLLEKNGKLYSIADVKISDEKVADAKGSGYSGLLLNKNGKLFSYEYDFKEEKYKTKKIEDNVKSIVDENTYIDKSNKEKNVKKVEQREEYYYNIYYQEIEVKNNNLYLNGKKVLKNVASTYGTLKSSILVVKTDGSIWRLDLDGNLKFKKVRSGKESAKKISTPTNVKAKKNGSKKVKISWKKVDGAKKYTIYRATSKKGKYKKIGTSKSNSYTDKKVEKKKTYYYKVVANTSEKLYDSKDSKVVKAKI